MSAERNDRPQMEALHVTEDSCSILISLVTFWSNLCRKWKTTPGISGFGNKHYRTIKLNCILPKFFQCLYLSGNVDVAISE